MQRSIQTAITQGHGNAILYAGAIGLMLSDVIPTPADGVYFWLLRKEHEKLVQGKITSKQFWQREAAAYYGLNPLWWGIVLASMVATKGDYTNKFKVGAAIIGAGAVVGVLYSNVKKDEVFYGK